MRPIIGITCGHLADGKEDRLYVDRGYAAAIAAAGGLPVLLPLCREEIVREHLQWVQGVLLPGGVDLDPAYFGEEPQYHLGRVDPDWDAFDLLVARLAMEMDLPLLGICRGIQVLNVAAGGSLYQDIPSQIRTAYKHFQSAPDWYPTHEVHLEHDTKLARIFGTETLRVNSFHHQSVKVVAPDFKIAAKARDAVIEGIESKSKSFVVGVQWHPETMWERDPHCLELFRALVQAAGERRGA